MAFVPHLVAHWTDVYNGSAILRTIVAFVHVAGLVAGGGAAIVADRATLITTRVGLPGRRQLDTIHNAHRVVVAGLGAVIVSGILLYAADVETYAVSRVFWIKMAMVAALMINGTILVGLGRDGVPADARMRRTMRVTALLSLSLWFLATLAGAALPNI